MNTDECVISSQKFFLVTHEWNNNEIGYFLVLLH